MISLSGLDILLSLILFFFFTLGFIYGFIHALGLIAGMVVGLWAANLYFEAVAEWISETIPFIDTSLPFVSGGTLEVISFVMIGVITFKLVTLAFEGIDRLLRLLYVLPFMKSFNRLLGALVGFLEAVLILSLFIHFLNQIDFLSTSVANVTKDSILAEILLDIGRFIAPLLPKIFASIRSFF